MKIRFLILILFTAVCLLCVPMVGGLDPSIAAENGLMENIQLILVLLIIAAFLLRLRGAERDLRSVFYCAISFGFACAMRELDVRQLNVPRWVELLGTGIGSDIIIGFLCLAIIFFAVKAGMSLKRRALRIPVLPFGVLSIASALTMLIAVAFEEYSLGGERSQIYEEYFEILSYIFLLTAALSANSLSRISSSSHESLGQRTLLPD